MGDVKCDNLYCGSGYVFMGNVDDEGRVICQQKMVEDKNNNCKIDGDEPDVLHVFDRAKFIGTYSLSNLNLEKYFSYLSNLQGGEMAAKNGYVRLARLFRKDAFDQGYKAGLDMVTLKMSTDYFISDHISDDPVRDFCLKYCDLCFFGKLLYDVLGSNGLPSSDVCKCE